MKKRRTSAEMPGYVGRSPLAGHGVSGFGSPPPLGQKLFGLYTVDGSTSVVRQDDDASNSGLLDLGPALPMVRQSSHMRKHSMHTPIFGPQVGAHLVQPPPLEGKSRRAPRRSSTDGLWAHTRGRRAVSDTQTSSGGSNNSVIVHNETPPWNASPEKSASESRVGGEDPEPTIPVRLRRWMHDAMKQHMYETAIFWGKHLVALETTEMAYNDAYWLAQAYFYTHQYARAELLLTTPLPSGLQDEEAAEQPGMRATTLSPHTDVLHEALEATRAQSILPDAIRTRYGHADMYGGPSDEPRAPSVGADRPSSRKTSRRRKRESASPDQTDPFHPSVRVPTLEEELEQTLRTSGRPGFKGPSLVNWSTPCRYLAAQCQVRLGKFHEALELTGEDHTRWTGAGKSSFVTPALDGGLKLGSSVCHLRGQIYLRLDEVAKAKEAFMLALALDVKNFDSFSALIDGNLLGAEEQWDFVQSLQFGAQAGDEPGAEEDFEWIRLMYETRLSQRSAALAKRAAAARQALLHRFPPLQSSPDVLLSLAEALYASLKYEDAYMITSHILALDPAYTPVLPVHITCMYYLPRLRPALFLLAHRLTETNPESCEAWYAVGVWYASAARWPEARRYFSKSSLLDPRFAPSWIAFGHSFSMEGESDQAITAYSTAARKFPSSGLPLLFIGMEHLLQGNKNLALLFLNSSAEELGTDPLCANERGVAAFQGGNMDEALAHFRTAADAVAATQQPAMAWVHVHLNLGLTYNRLHRSDEARPCLLRVIECDASCAAAYIALGMCAHRQGDLADAIGWYHEGLGIDPRDPIGTDLLALALEARVAQGVPEALLGPEVRGEAWDVHVDEVQAASYDTTQGSATMDESG